MKGTVVVLLVAGALQAQSVMVVDVSGTVKRVRGGGVALYEEVVTAHSLPPVFLAGQPVAVPWRLPYD